MSPYSECHRGEPNDYLPFSALTYFCPLSFTSSCKSLSYLCLCYCEHISDTGVELLGHIPTLTSIDLSGCDIHDHGVAGLRKNTNIRDLSLAEVEDLTDDGLQVSEILSQLYNTKLKNLCEKLSIAHKIVALLSGI